MKVSIVSIKKSGREYLVNAKRGDEPFKFTLNVGRKVFSLEQLKQKALEEIEMSYFTYEIAGNMKEFSKTKFRLCLCDSNYGLMKTKKQAYNRELKYEIDLVRDNVREAKEDVKEYEDDIKRAKSNLDYKQRELKTEQDRLTKLMSYKKGK